MALIHDIVEFFQNEFFPWLDDLSVQDVISRIQYGQKHKVQQIETPAPKEGIRPFLVMKVTFSPPSPQIRENSKGTDNGVIRKA